jgi:anti-sigma factor NepR-like protein
MIVTRFKTMQLVNEFAAPGVPCCGGLPLAENGMVEEQVRDFLDGKTHGEELFHALYDHVLDEPIPERMRALLRTGGAD